MSTAPKLDLFARYEVTLEMEGRIAAATPSDPVSVVEMVRRQMMRSMGVSRNETDSVELRRRVALHLADTGEDPSDLTDEKLFELAETKTSGGINVFFRDADGLWFPSHAIKSAIKEACNILFPKERWGKTGKGPVNFVAERVFVRPMHIHFERGGQAIKDADGIDMKQGRVTGPQGPRAIVTQYEYLERPELSFTLDVLRNGRAAEEMAERWPVIFSFMEENGIGALRKYTDYGTFVTTRFEERSA